MANEVVNKILDFLGVDNGAEQEDEEVLDNEYTYSYEDEEEQEDEEDKGIFGGRKKGKVYGMTQQQIKMKIAKPTTFEQAEDICILLRRILDVISGAVKVLDGHFEKVSNSIFIVAPFNYDIVNDMTREEIKNKLSVSWLK